MLVPGAPLGVTNACDLLMFGGAFMRVIITPIIGNCKMEMIDSG